MTLDVGAQYIMQKDRNMTNQGIYANPVASAYLFPRGNDWEEYKMFERYDPVRKLYTQYWPQVVVHIVCRILIGLTIVICVRMIKIVIC